MGEGDGTGGRGECVQQKQHTKDETEGFRALVHS
jgi:hypothetical protein